MSEFLIDIIDHTLEVFDSSASRNDEDYCERLEGEIDSQHFPNFQLRRVVPFVRKRAMFNHDVCLSQENCLWFYSYDKWRNSSNDFRPNSVKIPN